MLQKTISNPGPELKIGAWESLLVRGFSWLMEKSSSQATPIQSYLRSACSPRTATPLDIENTCESVGTWLALHGDKGLRKALDDQALQEIQVIDYFRHLISKARQDTTEQDLLRVRRSQVLFNVAYDHRMIQFGEQDGQMDCQDFKKFGKTLVALRKAVMNRTFVYPIFGVVYFSSQDRRFGHALTVKIEPDKWSFYDTQWGSDVRPFPETLGTTKKTTLVSGSFPGRTAWLTYARVGYLACLEDHLNAFLSAFVGFLETIPGRDIGKISALGLRLFIPDPDHLAAKQAVSSEERLLSCLKPPFKPI